METSGAPVEGTVKWSWSSLEQGWQYFNTQHLTASLTNIHSENLGSRTVSLVRHQYPAKDEADRGEKVQLHGNRDNQPLAELKQFNVGHREIVGHAGPGL